MPIDQDSLNTLGITDPLSKEGFYNACNAIFKREEDINQELKDVLAIQDIARSKEAEIAASLGLGLQNNQTGQWNTYFNCYEMTAQLADTGFNTTTTDAQIYFTYDGRGIKTSIQLSVSNTNFNPNDIESMFEDVYAAAVALAHELPVEQQAGYLATIARVRKEFEEQPGTICQVTTNNSLSKRFVFESTKFEPDSIEKIMADFYNGTLARKKNNVVEITNRASNLNNLFIHRLAIEMARAQQDEPEYLPKDYRELSSFVKAIRNKEVEIHAKKRRPVLVNIYPIGTDQWIMRNYIPNSDEPSTRRQLKGGMFSNDWNGEIEIISKKHDGSFERKAVPAGKDRRSSSIAILKHFSNKKKQQEEFEIVYDAFKKLIIQYARDELIASVNAGKPVPPEILIKEAYITLLSPFKGNVSSSILPAILTTENEYMQLKFTQQCLEKIAAETLSFTAQDCEYIRAHAELSATESSKLEHVKISHRSYYSNYMVNIFLGMPLEYLDKYNILSGKKPKNYRYFISGNKNRQQDIIEFINNTELLDPEIKYDLITMLQSNPITDRAALETILKNHAGIKDELRDLLEIYLNLEKYFHGDNIGISQSRLVTNYIMAAEDAIFADILGYTAHHTCKSGIDRTGLLALIKEARLSSRMDAAAEKDFVNKLLAGLKHSSSREIKTVNDPSARGLQIPASFMHGHVDGDGAETTIIKDFINKQNFDLVGKMKKRIFLVGKQAYENAIASAKRVTAEPHTTAVPPSEAAPVVFNFAAPPPQRPTVPPQSNPKAPQAYNASLAEAARNLKVVNRKNPRHPPEKNKNPNQ